MTYYKKIRKYWVRWLCVCSSPIIKLLFHTKTDNLLLGNFSWKFPNYGLSILLVSLKQELWNQIDLKINLVTHWNYLATLATTDTCLLNKKVLLPIIVVLCKNSLNTVIVTAVSGKHYQWNSSYWKLEQYWVRWLHPQ